MIPSVILSVCALVLAAATLGAAWRAPGALGPLNIAAWVGLVASAAALYAGVLVGPPAALAAAALAALALAPGTRVPALVAPAASMSASLGAGLGVAALVWASLPAPPAQAAAGQAAGHGLLLLTGQWSAWAAALSVTLAAGALGAWRPAASPGARPASWRWAPLSLGPAVAASCVGLALLGLWRADVPSSRYGLALRSELGPMMWGLAQSAGGERALGLRVHLEAPGVLEVLGLCGALALLASLGGGRLGARRAAALWAASGVSALGALGLILRAGHSPHLPAFEPYMTYAKMVGAELQIPEPVIMAGGFVQGKQLFVLWSSLLPELATLCAVALLCAASSYATLRAPALAAQGQGPSQPPQEQSATKPVRLDPEGLDGVGALWARDLMVSAAALTWIAWFMGVLSTWRMQATYGLASPNEWTALGIAVWTSGAAWLCFGQAPVWRRASPAVVAALIVVYVLISLAFEAPVALSFRV